jgi:hypothetical protein
MGFGTKRSTGGIGSGHRRSDSRWARGFSLLIVHICMYIHIYTPTCEYIYMCMDTYVHTYNALHTYIHTYMRRNISGNEKNQAQCSYPANQFWPNFGGIMACLILTNTHHFKTPASIPSGGWGLSSSPNDAWHGHWHMLRMAYLRCSLQMPLNPLFQKEAGSQVN